VRIAFLCNHPEAYCSEFPKFEAIHQLHGAALEPYYAISPIDFQDSYLRIVEKNWLGPWPIMCDGCIELSFDSFRLCKKDKLRKMDMHNPELLEVT